MTGCTRTARRLAAAAALALALLAAGVVVPIPEGWGQPGAPGSGSGGGWGQPGALRLPSGYAPPPGGRAPVGRGEARPAGGRSPVIGVIGYRPAVVARLDPRTLRPLPGPRIRLPYGISGYGWSPDRSLLVLGDLDDDALHVVDPVRLRRVATVDIGVVAEAPQALAWLGPRRLAVVAGDSADGATLVMADPVAGRVLSRRPLAPAGITAAAGAGDRMVLLSTSVDRIGPARLQVVDDRGRVRTAGLEGVDAGFQDPPDWDRPGAYGISREAALAVDPDGGRAFVVTAGATVAEVDLDSLQVTYRRLRQPASLLRRLAHWLVPPAEAKLNVGTWRAACWLGDGRMAVWGSESRVVGDVPAEQRSEQRPSGLKLIDTRTWTVGTLHPAATDATWQEGRLLAFGGTWDHETEREVGVGLTVYTPGDRRPRQLLGGQAVMEAHLNGDLVYAAVDTGAEDYASRVVSLASGQVLSSERPLPWLLLGTDDRPC
jgi:hypothetical protein